MKIPMVGLGTWELRDGECTKIVQLALELGYRHIDTAHNYGNHKAIQKAIKDFDRSQLFLTSKLALNLVDAKHVEKSVEKSCDLALEELGTDYLDLYLIHWPDRDLPMIKIYEAMENLVAKKKIKHAGVSNYTEHHLEDLGLTPWANQVEFHPFLYQKKLWDYCKKHGIQLIAYRPFGKKLLLKEPIFEKIAKHYKKTGSQIILRWLIQKGIPAIPKASKEKHLRENLEIFDFELSGDDMQVLDHLNKDQRFCGAENPEFNY